MKETELFGADYQISHDTTISTIKQIFDDEIKHCREDVDAKLAQYLEGFKDEFVSIFKQVYKDKEYKNLHSATSNK